MLASFYSFLKDTSPLELPEKLACEGIHLASRLALVRWGFLNEVVLLSSFCHWYFISPHHEATVEGGGIPFGKSLGCC